MCRSDTRMPGMGSNSARDITMPRTFRMVGLWHDLKVDIYPIPLKEITNLALNRPVWLGYFVFRSGDAGVYLLSFHKLCTHIYVDARECVREKSKGRSGVRMKAEGETGERHTPPVRVKPTCLARKYRSCQRFAPCKIDLRKVRLFAVQEVY